MFFLHGCKAPDLSSLSSSAKNIFKNVTEFENTANIEQEASLSKLKLLEIVDKTPLIADMSGSFKEAINSSVENDPSVLAAKASYETSLASINVVKSAKEFKISGTVLGGVEDLTDKTSGVAAILNGKKVIYDGGKINTQIAKERSLAFAALANYEIKKNESAFNSLSAWVNLKRYSALNDLIKARLEVLDPLIQQLETVAEAGIGDVSQVAAAERTVNMIKVTERDVSQQLSQSEVAFENMFGVVRPEISFEGEIVSAAVPTSAISDLVMVSPIVELNYAKYGAALANLNGVAAKDSFDVGFEAKIQKPFGGSEYDSDESVGLVVRKTLHDGGSLEAERQVAESQVSVAIDMIKHSFKETLKNVSLSQEVIASMSDAIVLANLNAENTADEISYLRKQLIIGQSTLDSVLSAEARLYEAESMAINFVADRYLAELTILMSLGKLNPLFDLN